MFCRQPWTDGESALGFLRAWVPTTGPKVTAVLAGDRIVRVRAM